MTLILIACRNVMQILFTNFIFRYALLAGVDIVIVEIKHESKLKYKLKCMSLVLFNFSTHFHFVSELHECSIHKVYYVHTIYNQVSRVRHH